MNATAIGTTRRERSEQARARAIIRFNGLLFHSLAAASFLESAVPLDTTRLGQVFAARPDAGRWLEQVWWLRRAARGRRLRDYLEATWPEFEWSAAYEEYCESRRPRLERIVGAALGALGQCVTAAQAAVFYRALARSADDPALRVLAHEAARDHGECFDYFRALFERGEGEERVGLVAGWRAVRAACARLSSRSPAIGRALQRCRPSITASSGRAWRRSSSATPVSEESSACCSCHGSSTSAARPRRRCPRRVLSGGCSPHRCRPLPSSVFPATLPPP
jgi:hypothetical protein